MNKNSNHPQCRDDLGEFLNSRDLIGTMVEVGSAWGEFAGIVLSKWKGKKLFMIDPWEDQDSKEYSEAYHHPDFNYWFRQCQDMCLKDNRAEMLKMLSSEAVKRFEDESLDCVYIDANHDYRHVMEDLINWYEKVKPGGVFGGHDYLTREDQYATIQVEKAVSDWASSRNLNFSITLCTSWWIIKP